MQAELDRVKWGFEWTDAKLLDNLNTVRRYLIKKYPDNAISLEIDNDQKRVIVDSISRFVDFDALPYDAEIADFLRSILQLHRIPISLFLLFILPISFDNRYHDCCD